MSYARPSHLSKFRDGSATDATVVIDALSDGLEAVEAKLDGSTEYGLGLLTPTDAKSARALLNAARAVEVNALDYGVVADGTTDDTTALQAAVTAAGQWGCTILPPGIIKATSLTVPLGAMVKGTTRQFGAGGTAGTELRFTSLTGSATAITLGDSASMKDLIVRGPGATVGTVKGIAGATHFLENVSVLAFATGHAVTNGYYCEFRGCEWSRNKTAMVTSDCYNINLYAPRIFCGYGTDDATYGTGIIGAARGMNIFGGAIEQFGGSGAIAMANGQHLNLFGVYMETALDANAGGVWADGMDKVSVAAYGCMVYLNGMTRWITTSGSTNATLVSKGNHFVCVDASAYTPVAYIVTGGQDVDLGSDNWSEVAKTGAVYVSSTSGGLSAPGFRIDIPQGAGVLAGRTLEGRSTLRLTKAQTLAANGAVTIDALSSRHEITLQANATSSTIINPVPGQEIMITFIQDATGGRTYVWPSNCKFAAGSAPSDTTANRVTTVTLRYDSSSGHWREVGRAVARTLRCPKVCAPKPIEMSWASGPSASGIRPQPAPRPRRRE